jgi:tRNA pseudouridine38/39 synthase
MTKDFNNLSRTELIEALKRLKGQNRDNRRRTESGKKKNFDFDTCVQRKIALKILYIGDAYHGFASVEDKNEGNTIEYHLFKALTTAKLIKDRSSACYSRCGRTDIGVSALCQIVSLNVRSKLNVNSPFALPPVKRIEGNEEIMATDSGMWEEIPYDMTLNGLLPEEIRVIGWCPVGNDFNARFDCNYRLYKYFFNSKNLNIEGMCEAAKLYEGTHDFKNFSKLDRSRPDKSTTRTVFFASVEKVEGDIYSFTVKGSSFLWHQVRCMMAILYLVGEGALLPSGIIKMLDRELTPVKPQYHLAAPQNLVLWECGFNEGVLNFQKQVVCVEEGKKKSIPYFRKSLINMTETLNLKKTILTSFLKEL